MRRALAVAAVFLAVAGWVFSWGLIWIAALAAVAVWLSLGGSGGSAERSPEAAEFPEQPGDGADFACGSDEPLRLPVEDALDLHAFAPRDIPDVTREYLEQSHRAGFREVRIIHGRGTGFQRDRVRRVLSGHPLVEDFSDAPPERGGWGATVVRLRVGDSEERDT